MFTDSHAHLNYESFSEDQTAVLKNARDNNVSTIINIALGPDPKVFEEAFALTSRRAKGRF